MLQKYVKISNVILPHLALILQSQSHITKISVAIPLLSHSFLANE